MDSIRLHHGNCFTGYLMLFIYQYRRNIFEDNTQMTFLFFNLLLMVGLSTTLIKFNPSFIYALPICIFPLVTKAFFDPRLGLFVHVLTVLLIGLLFQIALNMSYCKFWQVSLTILSADELYKRANLFLTVFQITLFTYWVTFPFYYPKWRCTIYKFLGVWTFCY